MNKGAKRQISPAEECQITYLDAPPSKRWSTIPIPWVWAVPETSFQGAQQGKGMKDDFTVEKPDNHYLIQVVKVNIISGKLCW